ncbi:MAG: PaaI family thioesterase [Candidatus Binatia bacterium]
MKHESVPPIPPERERRIIAELDAEPFIARVGVRCEEIRVDYARLRLASRPELRQGAGVVHGGAIATLLDTAVVGAIRSVYDERPRRLATIDLHLHYLDAVADEDVIAEARVRRRGRSIVFVAIDARTPAGREIAHAEGSYRISIDVADGAPSSG